VSETLEPSGQFVQSLARGLSVIRALNSPEPMSLSDVARASGLTRASARRFTLTLEHLGYVQQSAGRFSLTPQVLELGFAYLSALGLPEISQPHLQRLVNDVGESSSISVLDGSAVVYVARVPTRRIINVTINLGTRFPAYATSMGRVLLSGLDPEACTALLDQIELRPLTGRTITTRSELEVELERVRRQGYAIVDEEFEDGLRSVAAPICDREGRVVAAINLALAASRVSIEEIHRSLLSPLLRAAAAIEGDLGVGGALDPSRIPAPEASGDERPVSAHDAGKVQLHLAD
jgi:IclR family pca regulon transcriptional regulator